MIEWILIAIAAVIVLYFIVAFNSFVILKNRINNAWSQIDVQLKRRADLIPNLVETVKGYAKHEKSVFENVTKARSAMLGATTIKDKAKADNMITEALKSLFAVAENYPKLEASQNFKLLQEELSGTESKIAYSRQFYNDNVMDYNIKLEKFPTNIIGKMFGFKHREFFKTEGKEREVVKVSF